MATFTASAGADLVRAAERDDRPFGGSGADPRHGGGGNDALDGGAGDDRRRGGSGADVFVGRFGDGAAVITDFEDDVDRRRLNEDLRSGGLTAAQVVAQFAAPVAGGVLRTFAGGETIPVEGIANPGAAVSALEFIRSAAAPLRRPAAGPARARQPVCRTAAV